MSNDGDLKPDEATQSGGQRRQFLSGMVTGTAFGLVACPDNVSAQADKPAITRRALRPAGAPSADVGYSPAIVAEGQRLLFISGQGPEDVHADMETQIRQTFDRIGILLKEAGGSFANVVIVRSYWVHLARDLAAFRKIRREYLVEPFPASTAVGTTELAIPGLELEIEVIAVL
jgi:enamine deaminase RidA (YjgF/YER057c/UK114 family)